MSNPNEQQIGGEHYKKYPIQPWDYIMKNNIPWAEGCIIEWVTRWRDKGGVQDLEKAKHMIDKVMEMAAWSHEPIPLRTEQITMNELVDKATRGLYDLDMVDRISKYEPHCDCERCSAE